jgi:hypothetical protein
VDVGSLIVLVIAPLLVSAIVQVVLRTHAQARRGRPARADVVGSAGLALLVEREPVVRTSRREHPILHALATAGGSLLVDVGAKGDADWKGWDDVPPTGVTAT